MPYFNRLTPEVVASIKADLAAGMKHALIAQKHKLHVSSISKVNRGILGKSIQKALNGEARRTNPGAKYARLVPQMLALRAQKMKLKEIAAKLNMPYSAISYYLYGKHKQTEQGETQNGHKPLDTRFLIGFGCAELERTLTTIAQRLGLTPNLLRQGFSKFLESSEIR